MTHPWSESEVEMYVETLSINDAERVATILFHVSSLSVKPLPTGDDRIIRYLEQLIEDRRWVVVDKHIPPVYGEMRWLAARVLACEYAYQGIYKPIILKNVARPVDDSDVFRIKKYRMLQIGDIIEDDFMPATTEIIKPQDYCEWCSKEAIEKRRREQETDE